MLTQAGLRSAPPQPETPLIAPIPSATVVLRSKIAIDPALNPRSEVDDGLTDRREASMRDW
mgnify:CR=1 FL=1